MHSVEDGGIEGGEGRIDQILRGSARPSSKVRAQRPPSLEVIFSAICGGHSKRQDISVVFILRPDRRGDRFEAWTVH